MNLQTKKNINKIGLVCGLITLIEAGDSDQKRLLIRGPLRMGNNRCARSRHSYLNIEEVWGANGASDS